MRSTRASPFLPLLFAGCSFQAAFGASTQDLFHPLLWLKADASSVRLAPPASGGDMMRVQQWNDLSGNGIQLSQDVPSLQPAFNPDGFGPGRPSVHFDSEAVVKALKSPADTQSPTRDMTVLATIIPLTTTGNAIIGQGWNYQHEEHGWVFARGTCSANYFNEGKKPAPENVGFASGDYAANVNPLAWVTSSEGVSPTGQAQTVAARKRGRNVEVYVNGQMVARQDQFSADIKYDGVYVQGRSILIGAIEDVRNSLSDCSSRNRHNPFVGHIGEILVWDHYLNDTEFLHVNRHAEDGVFFAELLPVQRSLRITEPGGNIVEVDDGDWARHLEQAPTGSTVTFMRGKYQGGCGAHLIGKHLTLQSDGGRAETVIDCLNAAQHLQLTKSTLIIRGITFENGWAGTAGGGCMRADEGSHVLIADCALKGCRSEGDGGAIMLVSSQLDISDNSLLESNRARGSGGALALHNASACTVQKTHLRICTAHRRGGAISMMHSQLAVTSQVTLERNSAREGGAVSANAHSNLTLSDGVLVTHCTAEEVDWAQRCGGGENEMCVATQSSGKKGGFAWLALDGNGYTQEQQEYGIAMVIVPNWNVDRNVWKHTTCSQTWGSEVDRVSWWMVDLSEERAIGEVQIWNFRSYIGIESVADSKFQVLVSSVATMEGAAVCYDSTVNGDVSAFLQIPCRVRARFVWVAVEDNVWGLSLCEVKVLSDTFGNAGRGFVGGAIQLGEHSTLTATRDVEFAHTAATVGGGAVAASGSSVVKLAGGVRIAHARALVRGGGVLIEQESVLETDAGVEIRECSAGSGGAVFLSSSTLRGAGGLQMRGNAAFPGLSGLVDSGLVVSFGLTAPRETGSRHLLDGTNWAAVCAGGACATALEDGEGGGAVALDGDETTCISIASAAREQRWRLDLGQLRSIGYLGIRVPVHARPLTFRVLVSSTDGFDTAEECYSGTSSANPSFVDGEAEYRSCEELGGVQQLGSLKCFFVPPDSVPSSWDEAEAACATFGGHVATITSSAENELVQQVSGHTKTWIGKLGRGGGGSGDAAPRGFGWHDGSFTSYVNWGDVQAGVPPDEGLFFTFDELCIQMDAGASAAKWGAVQCATKLPYVCSAATSGPLPVVYEPPCVASARYVWVTTTDAALQLCEVAVFPPFAGSGGAVAARESSRVTLHDSILADNHAGSEGGAVFASTSSAVSIAGSTLAGNVATLKGGAVMVEAGSSVTADQAATVSSNHAAYGGALFANDARIHLSATQVQANTATDGGAVMLEFESEMEVLNSVFADNLAFSTGGSVAARQRSSVSLRGVSFVGETAQLGTGGALDVSSNSMVVGSGDITFANCTAGAGAAMHAGGKSVIRLTDGVKVLGCLSWGSEGGGAVTIVDLSTLHLEQSVLFRGNLAQNGAGIFADSSYIFVGHGVEFIGHTSARLGGAVLLQDSTMRAEHSVHFEDCEALSGGAVFAIRSSLHFQNGVSFDRCTASQSGGAIYVGANSSLWTSSDVAVRDSHARDGGCLFSGEASRISMTNGVRLERCIASGEGGGVYAATSSHLSASNDISVTSCVAGKGGGMLVNAGSVVILSTRVLLHHCSATTEGGAVFAVSTTLSLTGARFLACNSPLGAALSVYDGSIVSLQDTWVEDMIESREAALHAKRNVHLILTGVHGSNCSTLGDGGLVMAMEGSLVEVTDSTFNNIHSAGNGGVIFSSQTLVRLSGTRFAECSAGGHGGVLATTAELEVVGCHFLDCSAKHDAGALLSMQRARVLIAHSRFENMDSGGEGGAVKVDGALEISSSTFFHCRSAGPGGAIRVSVLFQQLNAESVLAKVSKTSFVECSSAADGGAISSKDANLHMSGSAVFSNEAGTTGGGVSLYDGRLTAHDCAFHGNLALDRGGALSVSNGDLNLSTVGLANNTARARGGGAVSVHDTTSFLADVYAVGNEALEGGGGVLFWQGRHEPEIASYAGGMCGAADVSWDQQWQECGPGFSGSRGSTCEECPAGTYKSAPGSEACVACPPPRLVSAPGSRSILACECRVGTVPADGGCVPCPAGSFWQKKGPGANGECKLCLPGSFQPAREATSCVACAPGLTSAAGSAGLENCTCADPGFPSNVACNTSSCVGAFDNPLGIDYRGCLHQTVSRRTCQRWDSQAPHAHIFRPEMYPDAGLNDNFCRNPDRDPGGIWCFTSDPDVPRERCSPPLECFECLDGTVEAWEEGQAAQFDCRGDNAACLCATCTASPACTEADGTDYRGCRARTRTGKLCQRWDTQSPHQHTELRNWPQHGLLHNYCRNPDGRPGPWCYTTDPETRWELCFDVEEAGWVQACLDDAEANHTCFDGILEAHDRDCTKPELYTNPCECQVCDRNPVCDASYRGCRMHTVSGLECQPWASQTPHTHTYTQDAYPGSGLMHAFCREPDGASSSPWCYTTDPNVRWDYCFEANATGDWSKSCAEDAEATADAAMPDVGQPPGQCEACPTGTFATAFGCSQCPPLTSMESAEDVDVEAVCDLTPQCDASYRGCRKTTVSGLECQPWASQTPHTHSYTQEKYPGGNLVENFCREPDGASYSPWCYTTDPGVRWDYCFEADATGDWSGSCAEDAEAEAVCDLHPVCDASYRGCRRTTVNGRECQPWASNAPHFHLYTPDRYPDNGLVENFCRSTGEDGLLAGEDGASTAPWCYTTDPDVRWDYCFEPAYGNWAQSCAEDSAESEPAEAGSVPTVFDCKCTPGFSGPPGGPCTPCAAGTFKAATRDGECTPCPEGTYQSQRGATACDACATFGAEISSPRGSVSVQDCECSAGYGATNLTDVRAVVVRQMDPELLQLAEIEIYTRKDPGTNIAPLCECFELPAVGLNWGGQNANDGDLETFTNWERPQRAVDLETFTNSGRQKQAGRNFVMCVLPQPEPLSRIWLAPNPGSLSTLKNLRVELYASVSIQTEQNTGIYQPETLIWIQPLLHPETNERWTANLNINVVCERCKTKPRGEICDRTPVCDASYRGCRKTTVSGLECQPWASQAPHEHSYTQEKYPGGNLVENFCREPDGASSSPWCYTTDPDVRWDYCFEANATGDWSGSCAEDAEADAICDLHPVCDASYRGCRMHTVNGRDCQPWASQTPHAHSYTQDTYPDSDLVHSFCREPDGASSSPWCYTTDPDVRWDYCFVSDATGDWSKSCADDAEATSIAGLPPHAAGTVEDVNGGSACEFCSKETMENCLCKAGYTGPDEGPCVACAPGSFKDVVGSGPCLCKPGFTGPNDGPCVACAPGSYKAVAGAEECTTCPAGLTSPAGSSSCNACPVGTEIQGSGIDSTCVPCPPHSWTNDFVLVFRQTFPFVYFPDTVLSYSPNNPEAPNFSILDELWRYQGSDGKFHFKIYYPELDTFNEWKQSINPVTMPGQSSVRPVEGFEAITIQEPGWDVFPFGGLEKNEDVGWETWRNSPSCFLDGTVGRQENYFTIGAYEIWYDFGYPGIRAGSYTGPMGPVRQVELYVFSVRNSSECQCSQGFTGPDGHGGECRACAAGTFKGEAGSAPCLECPPGFFSAEGSAKCATCLAGTYRSGASTSTVCASCPEHSSSPDHSLAQASCRCNTGFAGPPGGPCEPCAEGTYSEANECTMCPENVTSPAQSGSRKDCRPRAPCGPGSVPGAEGACAPCPEGTYKHAGGWACVACPELSVSPAGSDSVESCVCLAGTGGDAATGSCVKCAPNSFKAQDANGDCPACPPNTDTDGATDAVATDRELCLEGPLFAGDTCATCTASPACTEADGTDYRGCRTRTRTGKLCQRWDTQSPHQHGLTAENHPGHGLVSNYCRNPDGQPGPWCYTTDPETRWELCFDVQVEETWGQACLDDAKNFAICDLEPVCDASYRGCRKTTVSGLECQPWASQAPHEHSYTQEKYPGGNLVENFCREPDGASSSPWCYTTDPDVRWDYCFEADATGDWSGSCAEDAEADAICDLHPVCDASYRGCRKTTVSGRECQPWASQVPHAHTYTQDTYPDSDLVHSFCREPDGASSSPWCYTTDPDVRWDYCFEANATGDWSGSCVDDAESCDRNPDCGSTGGYRGCRRTTVSGRECQPWASQAPHTHSYTQGRYPADVLVENFCRDPDDGGYVPWCYTTDPNVRWENCFKEQTGSACGIDVSGAKVCDCAAGYSGPGFGGPAEGVDSCVPCAPGHYKDRSGPQDCTACPVGSFAALPGSVACQQPTACPAGSFHEGELAWKNCTWCPENSVNAPDSTSCRCNAGYEPTQDGQCVECDEGTYSGGAGGACLPCEPGSVAAHRGSSGCTPCPEGTFHDMAASSSACAACPEHSSSARGSVGCRCDAGFFGPDGAVPCQACVRGTHQPSSGEAACVACPPAHFAPELGMTACASCAAGTYHAGTASAAACLPCPPNTWSAAESAGPESCHCKPGYARAAGSQECAACQPGTFKPAAGPGACQPCPAHAISRAAASSLAHCLCTAGFVGSASGACVACDVAGGGCHPNAARYGPCEASTYAALTFHGPAVAFPGSAFDAEVRKLDVYGQVVVDAQSTLQVIAVEPNSSATDPTVAVLGVISSPLRAGVSQFRISVAPTYSSWDETAGVTQLYRQPHLRFEGEDVLDGGLMRSEVQPIRMSSGFGVCHAGEILDLQQTAEGLYQGACQVCKPGTYSRRPLKSVDGAGRALALPECLACPAGGTCPGGSDVSFAVGDWEEVDGRFRLVRCPVGHRMVDAPHDAQECQRCEANEFIYKSDDPRYSCQRCPPGFRCPRGAPPAGRTTLPIELELAGLEGHTSLTFLQAAIAEALQMALAGQEGSAVVTLLCTSEAACLQLELAFARRRAARALVVPVDVVSDSIPLQQLAQTVAADAFRASLVDNLVAYAGNVSVKVHVADSDLAAASVGEFKVREGELVLVSCPAGHLVVNSSTETQECFECEPLTYSFDPLDGCTGGGGACRPRTCQPCPAGAACLGGAGFQPRVPRSTWAPQATSQGHTAMRIVGCPAGYVLVRTDDPLRDECIRCPLSTYSVQPADFGSWTMAVAEAEKAVSMCQPCPEGGVCGGGSEVVPREGFWKPPAPAQAGLRRAGAGQVALYRCNAGACLEGGVCAEGRDPDGIVCAVCAEGYAGSACSKCHQSQGVYEGVAAALAAVVLLLVWYVVSIRPILQGGREASDLAKTKSPGAFAYLKTLREQGILRGITIIVAFWQIVGTFETVYNIAWPDRLLYAWRIGAVLRLDLEAVSGFNCLAAKWTYFTFLRIYALLPIVVTAFIYLPTAVYMLVRRDWRQSVFAKEMHNKSLFCCMFFVCLIYPMLAVLTVRGFSCKLIEDQDLLAADYQTQCPVGGASTMWVWVLASVLAYPLGIPVMTWVLLWRLRVPHMARRKREYALLNELMRKLMRDMPQRLECRLAQCVRTQQSLHGGTMEDAAMAVYDKCVLVRDDGRAVLVNHPDLDVSIHTNLDDKFSELLDRVGGEMAIKGHRHQFQALVMEAHAQANVVLGVENWDTITDAQLEALCKFRWSEGGGGQLTGQPALLLPEFWKEACSTRGQMKEFLLTVGNQLVSAGMLIVPVLKWDREASVEERTALDRFGFLIESYKVEFWYFEIVEMVRKFFMSGLILYIMPDSPEQIAAGLVISVLFRSVFLYAKPFVSDTVARMQNAALSTLSVTLFYGLMLYVKTHRPGHYDEELWDTILLVLLIGLHTSMFMIPLVVVAKMLFTAARRRRAASRYASATSVVPPTPSSKLRSSPQYQNAPPPALSERKTESTLQEGSSEDVSRHSYRHKAYAQSSIAPAVTLPLLNAPASPDFSAKKPQVQSQDQIEEERPPSPTRACLVSHEGVDISVPAALGLPTVSDPEVDVRAHRAGAGAAGVRTPTADLAVQPGRDQHASSEAPTMLFADIGFPEHS